MNQPDPITDRDKADWLAKPGGPDTVAQVVAPPSEVTGTYAPRAAKSDLAAARLPSIPGYDLLGVLGRGGMGVVYQARHLALNRVVALKMILGAGHAGESDRARFRTEAQAVAHLQHPNIVQVYEVGEHDGHPFFSLEYLGGGSLDRQTGTPQNPAAAARTVKQLAEAMAYAHANNIIHRDLKPANILLTEALGQAAAGGETQVRSQGASSSHASASASFLIPVPKISDFGLAKRLGEDSEQTRTGAVLGTPSYMSPEQAMGQSRDVGPLADLYSLGAILYALLTGMPPFRGATVLDTLEQVRTQQPVPVRQLQPKVPRDLETICIKCLQKDPRKRYANCLELADDLDRFLAGEPIKARPVSTPERVVRWCKRHPGVASLSGLMVLLVLVALAWLSILSWNLDIARQAAEDEKNKVLKLNVDLTEANGIAERETKNALKLAGDLTVANKMVEKERNEALESEKLALHQSEVALKSLESIVKQVQDELEDVPGTGQARKNLLNEALRLLRTVNETSGNTTKLLAQRLMAHNQMGQIYWTQERRREAAEQYTLSRKLALQVLALDPTSDVARKDLAAATLKAADVHIYFRNEPDAAAEHLRECRKLYEAMVDQLGSHPEGNPALPLGKRVARRDAERGMADTYDRFAELASRAGDPAGAAGWLEKGRAIRQRLYDETDRADHMRRDAQVSILGQSIMLLASLRYAQGDLKANLAGRKQVALLRREVAEHRPNSLRALGMWAAAEGDLSDALLLSGEPKEALACASKSLEVVQQVAAAHPEDVDYRGRVAHAYYRTAVGWMRLGDRKAALGEFQKSLAIRRKLYDEQPDAVLRRAHTQPIMLLLARCGDHAGAEKLALAQREFWLKRKDNSVQLSEVASGFALCVGAVAPEKQENQLSADEKKLRQHYVELALDTFRQAQANGFTDVLFVDFDPDVDPLRGIAAFEEWRKSFRSAVRPEK